MNTIAISTTNSSIAEPVKSAWTFTSTMDDSAHSEAQLVLNKWSSTQDDEVDEDLMMMDTEDMPGVVSESDHSESSSSSSFSSSTSHHHHDHYCNDNDGNDVDVDVDDILMMKLDEEDGLLMDDLLDVDGTDDDDLQMLESVLSSSPLISSSAGGRNGNSSSSCRRWSTVSASPDAFFSSSVLQGSASSSHHHHHHHQQQQPSSVLDERLQQTVLKLQESMKRSSETRRSLYAQSATLSNYRRTHSVRQVLSNVEYTSRGVARSFSDPTPLSQMQHSLR